MVALSLVIGILAGHTCLAQQHAAAETSWYSPAPGTRFLWNLDSMDGESEVAHEPELRDVPGIQVYGVELDNWSRRQTAAYHEAGKRVICSFPAGCFRSGTPKEDQFDAACYCGKRDECMVAGEPDNVQTVMKKRFDMAATMGCDGVVPDCTDSYLKSPGWGNTLMDQYRHLNFLSDAAHQRNMSIALKDGLDMLKRQPSVAERIDFVVLEECMTSNTCGRYDDLLDPTKATFKVKYNHTISCPNPSSFGFSSDTFNADYRKVLKFCQGSSSTVIDRWATAKVYLMLLLGAMTSALVLA